MEHLKKFPYDYYMIGPNDLDLMRKLFAAGTEHRKYMRQIFVSLDVTAPLYWVAQLDTYKIGTTKNSCSFMHKGTAEPYTISDFSVHDSRVYKVLTPCERKQYELHYPYETDEFRIFKCENGREYKVFKNGRIVAKPFEYTDSKGRHRVFEEKECKPTRTTSGYYEVHIGGRSGEKWVLHRLVAYMWLDNPENFGTVNHIDGDKGNNCVENLEWCDLSENIRKGFETGLFENGKSLRASYLKWKNGHTVIDPHVKAQLIADHINKGLTCRQLAQKYDVTIKQANNMISMPGAENRKLFELCYIWENVINTLNELRLAYLETKDDEFFQQIARTLHIGIYSYISAGYLHCSCLQDNAFVIQACNNLSFMHAHLAHEIGSLSSCRIYGNIPCIFKYRKIPQTVNYLPVGSLGKQIHTYHNSSPL